MKLPEELEIELIYQGYRRFGMSIEDALEISEIKSKKQRHKLFLIKKYGAKCNICGSEENLTVDHIIPVRITGQQRKANLSNKQILCFPCNWNKDNNRKMPRIHKGIVWKKKGPESMTDRGPGRERLAQSRGEVIV